MALAYLVGKASAKPLRVNISIPLILIVSILPDVDIALDTISGAEFHRGITHSLLFAVLLFVPFFWKYKKQAIPYFLALLSHSLIGDFVMGGNVLFLWPLQVGFGLVQFGGPVIKVLSTGDEVAELALFLVATAVMYKTRDYHVFFKANKTNLLLLIPTATVLMPPLIGYPLAQPLLYTFPALAIAHIVYLILFVVAITITLHKLCHLKNSKQANPNLPNIS
jgi:membrane-bound metal-dependent hydrolase YbcI (DUF457 family)